MPASARQRQQHAQPRGDGEGRVFGREEEQAGELPKGTALVNSGHGKQSVLAQRAV